MLDWMHREPVGPSMKLLVVVSSLDLRQPYSATPAWWQLMKGLAEAGTEIIATPYQGRPRETLWWRAEANPALWQGSLFRSARGLWRWLAPPTLPGAALVDNSEARPESLAARLTRASAQSFIAPIWSRHLERLLMKHRGIQALLFLSTPPNHLRGVAAQIQERHGLPALFYDGDIPASLPKMQGFATGFRIYDGADLGEFSAVISNSLGGEEALRNLGARATHTLFYGVDESLFSPLAAAKQDIDLFFYGHGREYREEWLDALITEPSEQLPTRRFAVRGRQLGGLGRATDLPYASFNALRAYVARSKINLCITRRAHARLYASSSMRPFELAGMGACIVANPYEGIEEWFLPEREIIVVASAAAAVERYEYLLANETARRALGLAARARVLKQHTMRHRAQELLGILRRYC